MQNVDEAITPQIVDGSRQLAIEIKAQRELALAKPRDEARALAMCLDEFELAPEFAEEAFYSIPYNKGTEKETLVEGLSVKASRAAVRRWGNCAVASRIAAETEDSFECEGLLADFETNSFFRRMVRVSKTYISSGTRIPQPLVGVHLTNAVQSGLSKAERNASLSALPEYFKRRLFEAAKKIAGQKGKKEGKTVKQRMEAMIADFGKLKVEKARVEAYIAANFTKDADPDEVLGTMRGVFNAIKDGQVRADEVFAERKAEAAGPVKLEDIPGAGL